MFYKCHSLRGRSFLTPDTRLEKILRGTKILTENLMGMITFGRKLRGAKFSTVHLLMGIKYFGVDEFLSVVKFSGDIL